MAKFHFSSYWRNWSRVLSDKHPFPGPFVEVNLTPIPSSIETWESKVAGIHIRCHGTSRGRGDIETDILPPEVEEKMRQNLSPEIVDRLLNEDLLSQIDFEKWRKVQNGGAPLAKCHK